jgi:four helix bundle protein
MVDGSWLMEEGKVITRVEDMPVFNLVYGLALDVEKQTRAFGRDFTWLRSQLARSAESVAANMVEGFYSQYSTEYLQSLDRCRREARETQLHLKFAVDAGLISDGSYKEFVCRYEDSLMQLSNLIRSIEGKISRTGKAKPGFGCVREDSAEWAALSEHQPSTINH